MRPADAAYFDRPETWKDYGASDAGAHAERLALIRRLIPHGVESLLDVGCGNGLLTNQLLDICPRVVGCDRAREPLSHFKGEAVQADAVALPLPDASFDIVLSAEMVEHIPNDARPKVLSEMARVSRRWIILAVPYREDLYAWTARCPRCRTHFHVWGHMASFTPVWLRSAYAEWGFAVREFHLCGARFALAPRPVAWLRVHVFGMWYTGEKNSHCPRCGFNGFPVEKPWSLEQKVFWRFQRTVNRLFGRTSQPYWQMALFEK